MSSNRTDDKPFDKEGFKPLEELPLQKGERKVQFPENLDESRNSDDELPQAKTVQKLHSLDDPGNEKISKALSKDGTPTDDLWDSPYEEILRGEFPEFQRYKHVRSKGLAYVMAVHKSRLIIYNSWYVGITTVVVVACLFLQNIRLACCNKNADLGFDIAMLVMLAFLLIDMLLNLIGWPVYVISFDFWSDISSMIVLIFDLSMVREKLYDADWRTHMPAVWGFYYALDIIRLARLARLIRLYFQKKYVRKYQYFMKFYEVNEEEARLLANNIKRRFDDDDDEDFQGDGQALQMMRRGTEAMDRSRSSSRQTARMTSAGSNKDRVSSYNKKLVGEDGEATGGEIVGGFSAKQKMRRQKRKRKFRISRISQRILYLTTKRVLFTIILLYVILPLLSLTFYYPPYDAPQVELGFLTTFTDTSLMISYLSSVAVPFYDGKNYQLLKVVWEGADLGINTPGYDDSALRESEIGLFSLSFQNSSIYISLRYWVQIQAILNILRMIFVLVVYFLRLYAFHKDASDKILTPIDRLLEKVKMMAKNPSQALHLSGEYRENKNTDLVVIEDVIQKMAYLLVLGFGEAGNSILSKVLTISKDLNVDYLGKPNTVFAIFGFCDIRNFTDVTEILVDDVLNFVNSIAKIVHTEVGENQGGANKNIGDAFLVVWRLKGKNKSNIEDFTRPSQDPKKIERLHRVYSKVNRQSSYMGRNRGSSGLSEGSGFLDPMFLQELMEDEPRESRDRVVSVEEYEERRANNLSNSSIAELSLISFLRIMAQLTVNPVIRRYNANKRLNKGLPGYKVNLGFGLHAGSAIEGAIGSTLKIDMSYLSHNVNMAPRLEGLTKVYKVPLLFTSSLYSLFNTPKLQEICRRVDRVYITGTSDYYDLYTVDTYTPDLERAYDAGLVSREDKYNIAIPESEDDFYNKNAELSYMTNAKVLKSERDLRMENITASYLTNEHQLEESRIRTIAMKENVEDEYIEYDAIQRMWEFLIGDKPTAILIGHDSESALKKRREEMAGMYMTAINYYLEANGPQDKDKWEIARIELEKLAEKSGKDVRYLSVYEYMKSTDFVPPEDFKAGRMTD